MADASYQPKTYRKQGGDTFVVASGGLIDIETGGDLKYNGDSLIDEIAALSGLDATELGFVDGALSGTAVASKAAVYDAAGHLARTQAAPAAKTVTAGITAAELVAGLVTTTGVTGPSIHQLPTGTELDAVLPAFVAGDSFDFTIINTGTGASDDATITVNTDVTIVGNPTVGALTDATILSGSGTFRARRTAANTYVVYRIA